MRVVSLVPSLTETLLEAGVEVVGRTRFCLHPSSRVSGIPKVGGTKDWNWPKIQALKPDLLILDCEENPKFMSEQNEIPFHATHVAGIADMPKTLHDLAEICSNNSLKKIAGEWSELVTRKPTPQKEIPGIVEWGRKPTKPIENVVYLIWKDPWMAVGPGTFIASVLEFSGQSLAPLAEKYPKVDLQQFDPDKTLLLFSSEPYPFLKRRHGLDELGFAYAFVNGESFSWFGIRSLRFLQSIR